MDECLQLLDEQKECPNDDTLVQQVRLQLIAENQQNLGISYKTTIEPAKHRDLAFLYLKDLHSQFEDMKTRFLTESSTNGKLLCTYLIQNIISYYNRSHSFTPI